MKPTTYVLIKAENLSEKCCDVNIGSRDNNDKKTCHTSYFQSSTGCLILCYTLIRLFEYLTSRISIKRDREIPDIDKFVVIKTKIYHCERKVFINLGRFDNKNKCQ